MSISGVSSKVVVSRSTVVILYTVFARLSALCGCKLGNFSVAGVLSNICLTAPPNECRSQCYKARGKVCDLVWVTSGGKFNMRQSLALAGPPKSAKIRGGGGCS